MSIFAELLPTSVRHRLSYAKRSFSVRRVRTEAQRQDLITRNSLTERDRELLAKISSRISPNDGMYAGNGSHYFGVGLSAINCIESALATSGSREPARVLDMPCGHGRVLRFLKERFSGAEITACEIDPHGLDFCAKEFGVNGCRSNEDLDVLFFNTKFDLIWCGSLVSHLPEAGIAALLNLFERSLSDTGVAVLSSHGDFVAEQIRGQLLDYGLPDEETVSIVRAFYAEGFGFRNYRSSPGYGVSLISKERMTALAKKSGLRHVHFAPRAWDRHHDIHALARLPMGDRE